MATSLVFLTYQTVKIYILSWEGLPLRHQFDIGITAKRVLDFSNEYTVEEVFHFYNVLQTAEQTL